MEITAQEKKPAIVGKEFKRKQIKKIDIYMRNMITRRVTIPMSQVGKNLKIILHKIISSQIEGKCTVEGYIKPGTVKVLTYSNGILSGDEISFEVVFECLACLPVEGMHIKVVAKNITKAGIRAETDDEVSPVVVFVARDHHYKGQTAEYFASIKEGDIINVRVIGQRYELNDKYISVIAELLQSSEEKAKIKAKPRFVIVD
jgi:DNA-directed RNA polymerase subunit E'/Rpb7